MTAEGIIDVTGTPLTPSPRGEKCLGNGEHPEYECCCDECDHYLYCFAQCEMGPKEKTAEKAEQEIANKGKKL